jgi:hypothetical protein
MIRNRARDLPACSIVPQPTTLPCAPLLYVPPDLALKLSIECLYECRFILRINSDRFLMELPIVVCDGDEGNII